MQAGSEINVGWGKNATKMNTFNDNSQIHDKLNLLLLLRLQWNVGNESMLTEAFKYKIAPDYFAMLSILTNYTHFCSVYEYNEQSEVSFSYRWKDEFS